MTSPLNPDGEHVESLEYLNEYGRLIVDVSQLVTSFETHNIKRESETTFQFYAVNENFEVPTNIEDAVGVINSANITFADSDFKSITLELFGQTGTYLISRNEGPELYNSEDTVFHFTPLDVVDQESLTKDERKKLPRVAGNGDDFERTYDAIAGVSSSEFLSILMQITHPSIALHLGTKQRGDIPEEINIFQQDIYASLVESSRITSISQIGYLHYDLLAADNTTLTYFFEAGQPESFSLTTLDELTGSPLKVTGTMTIDEHGRRSMSLQSLQRAASPGATIAPDLPVDSVFHTAPTIRELKVMHEIITDELTSLQELPQKSEATDDEISADSVAVSTDIDEYVYAKVNAENDRREQLFNYELDALIAEQREDDEN